METTKNKTEYTDLVENVTKIKNEIIDHIVEQENHDDFISIDVPLLLEKYLKQTQQLLWRYNKLNDVIGNFSVDLIDKSIEDLEKMLEQTENITLKKRCEASIIQYETHKETLNHYTSQKEKIKEHLDATVYSLLKIKYDLLNLQSKDSDKLRLEFYKNFQNSNILNLLSDDNDNQT